MMADNSSEGNKDSSTEWDSANNGGIFPSHSPSKSPNKKKKQKQTRRSSSLSSSRSKPPNKKVQKVKSHKTKNVHAIIPLSIHQLRLLSKDLHHQLLSILHLVKDFKS